MRNLLIVLTVLTSWVVAPVSAQVSGNSPAPSTHGLKLVLKQDENSVEQESFKTCVLRHPLLACVPLTLVLRNEGSETVLRWSTTCSMDYWFEITDNEGSWQRFPRELLLCSRNMLFVKALAPGESYELHMKLADPTLLLDTELPRAHGSYKDEWITPTRGYTLLTGQRSPTIRVRWNITGCVGAQKGSQQSMNPFDRSLCLGGNEPEQDFILLQSNELELGKVRGNSK